MLISRSAITIKSAQICDALAIADVFHLAWRNTYMGIIPHEYLERIIKKRGVAWWRSAIRSPDGVSVLKFDGRVVGYAICGHNRYKNTHQGEIYELYIKPDYQGIGLGELLFEACLNTLDERRLRGMILWCLNDNTNAIEFYERRGGLPIASRYDAFGKTRLKKTAFSWVD